ncbi:MAG: glycosyltransferase family 2 protein [Pyrinomonadaceae bacterium]
MIFIFYFFAAVLVWLSFNSFRGGIAYLRFFRSELEKKRSDFTPFASIISPCKGLDEDLKRNLAALTEQDYPAYEIIFVVDSKDDPAVAVINEVIETVNDRVGVSAKMVNAPKAVRCAQKIANLREAVLHIDASSQAFVFVDSDARPSPDWLRTLVAPLADEHIGAATGYRWFFSRNPTFGSELRSAWNASIASALGPDRSSNFCWGGSTAIRRDVFERIGMRDRWIGTLSDDFAVTDALKDAGLPIVFVPQALTASVEDCTFRQMLEFTTRQMKITRVGATKLWVISFLGSALFNSVMIAAFLIVLLSRSNDLAVATAITTLVVVSVFSIGKSWLRLNAVHLVLTRYTFEISRQFWTQNTLWLISPAIFFYNCLAASASRRVTWRGITYELKSPTETVIISTE